MTPLTVLGGYLGAGKTTIINGLLTSLAQVTDNPRIAVLINDFGAINIDAKLIRKHQGRTVELTSGCVCCDIQDDLGSALDALRGESFAQVLVEASGVAYPAKVANYALTWPGYRPAGILVAVDALNVEDQKKDKFIGHLIDAQITEADLLLLTKLDQLDCNRRQALRDSLPTPAVVVDYGCVDADILLAPTLSRPDSPVVKDHSDQFRTLDYQSERILDHDRLLSFLDGLPEPVVRAKGWIHDDQGAWWLQSVGNRWTLEPATAIPDGTSLVFIALAKPGIGAMLSGLKHALQSL